MTSAATPDMQSKTQPGGLLFKLPAELRLEIYDLLFPHETVGLFAVRNQLLKAPNAKASAGASVAILTTCHAIHDEARPALYANTHFDVSCSLELAPAAWRTMVEAKWGPFRWLPRMTLERSINIQHARNISLNIKFTNEALSKSWGNTWLDKLPAHLSRMSNLKSLHIKLSTDRLHFNDVHKQADHVLPLLAKLQCAGSVTAAMDVSLGDVGFEVARYDAMRRTLGATDKTQEAYTAALAVLSTRHGSFDRELVLLSTRLNSKASERIKIVKGVGWFERDASRIQAHKLRREIRACHGSRSDLAESSEEDADSGVIDQ